MVGSERRDSRPAGRRPATGWPLPSTATLACSSMPSSGPPNEAR
jgi:hypothetical protein